MVSLSNHEGRTLRGPQNLAPARALPCIPRNSPLYAASHRDHPGQIHTQVRRVGIEAGCSIRWRETAATLRRHNR